MTTGEHEYLLVVFVYPNHDRWRSSVRFRRDPRLRVVENGSGIQSVGASRIPQSKVSTLGGDRGTLLPRIAGARTGPKITEKSNFCDGKK